MFDSLPSEADAQRAIKDTQVVGSRQSVDGVILRPCALALADSTCSCHCPQHGLPGYDDCSIFGNLSLRHWSSLITRYLFIRQRQLGRIPHWGGWKIPRGMWRSCWRRHGKGLRRYDGSSRDSCTRFVLWFVNNLHWLCHIDRVTLGQEE